MCTSRTPSRNSARSPPRSASCWTSLRETACGLAPWPAGEGAKPQAGRSVMDFALPELGEGVYEAEVVRWLVKPGDAVKRGQALLEVMTDKATMEVPSPFIGKITQLNGEPGQQIKVGSVVVHYDGEPHRAATYEQQPPETPARRATPKARPA